LEKLSKFYSELSNEDRLRILFLTADERLNLTQIAIRIHASIQETSRNLTRLRKDKFVRKTAEGHYRITPYGRANLYIITNQKYLCKNQDYYSRHNVSDIPTEFICRIGEMENCTKIDRIMKVILQIEQCIAKSEQKILLMYDQVISSSLLTIENKIKSGIILTQILPKDVFLSVDIKRIITGSNHERTLSQVKSFLLVTEKEALVAHSDWYDRIDYNEAFLTQDQTARKWCLDLFNYFWEKSESNHIINSKCS
jgi:predicted transcriptional regulator